MPSAPPLTDKVVEPPTHIGLADAPTPVGAVEGVFTLMVWLTVQFPMV